MAVCEGEEHAWNSTRFRIPTTSSDGSSHVTVDAGEHVGVEAPIFRLNGFGQALAINCGQAFLQD